MACAHPERVASLTSINVGVVRAYRWHYLARIWRTPGLGELFMATTSRSGFHLILRRGDLRGLPRAFIDEMSDNWDAGTRHAPRDIATLSRHQRPRCGRRFGRARRTAAGARPPDVLG